MNECMCISGLFVGGAVMFFRVVFVLSFLP